MNRRGIGDQTASHVIDAPKLLSVVVASVHSAYDLEMYLDAIIEQAQDKNIEVIVADCCRSDSPGNITIKYPNVVFIRFPEKTTLPALLGAGIARSTGQIIAITDSTCSPDKHWVSAVLKAHESSYPVIGGAVEIGGCKKWVDWAAYFCEYGQFMNPLKEGTANELPGNNISFKRWTLDKGREFVENGFWKTYWCRRLRKEGIELMLSPLIVVYYKKSYLLIPFLIRRFHHGRCFAGMRVAEISTLERLLYAAGSPALPFLFLARTIKVVASKKRYLKEFVFSFPIFLLAIMSWSFGEFCGYLVGAGKSCSHVC